MSFRSRVIVSMWIIQNDKSKILSTKNIFLNIWDISKWEYAKIEIGEIDVAVWALVWMNANSDWLKRQRDRDLRPSKYRAMEECWRLQISKPLIEVEIREEDREKTCLRDLLRWQGTGWDRTNSLSNILEDEMGKIQIRISSLGNKVDIYAMESNISVHPWES